MLSLFLVLQLLLSFLVEPVMAYHGIQIGGTDKSRFWPKHANGLHIVEYCYSDKTARDALQKHLDPAVNAWKKKIGAPGKDNGHALAFKRA
jgi:hypothetical protein